MNEQTISLAQRIVEVVVPLALGIVILLYGRRVFWILGGAAVGFLGGIAVGLALEPSALQVTTSDFSIDFQTPAGPPIFIGILIAAIIGIVITLRAPQAAASIVGFVGGAVIAYIILAFFAVNLSEPIRRSLMLIAGVGFAFVGLRNPNQTMILLSTLVGAGLVLQGARLNWNEPVSAIIWLLLMLIGIIFQTNSLRLQRLKAKAL